MTDADVERQILAARSRMEQNRADVSRRLRLAADAVDRVRFVDGIGGRVPKDRDPSKIVGDICHEVNWAVANLPIQTMLTWSAEIAELKALPDDAD